MPERSKPGLLLINTGTPAAPEVAAVRRYLREFLLDPRVIDLPGWQRRLLVDAIIVPRRAARSAAAYRAIWTAQGSPLLVHCRALAEGLRARLLAPGGRFGEVALAMRYGQPAIRDGLLQLLRAGCDALLVLPLFPQHAEASSGSALAAAGEAAAELCPDLPLRAVPPFFDHPAYIAALAAHARQHLGAESPPRLIVSFHGLPLRQLRKQQLPGCLARPDCCEPLTAERRGCYRAQCAATARLLGQALGLPAERVLLCFQSRMGRARWIGPYTEELLAQLPRGGVRRAALISPSFVADCVETLEELGLRAQQRFARAGGEALRVIPALNAEPRWVAALAAIADEALGAGAA